MKPVVKVAVSLLITVIIFSAFVIFAFSGLFTLVETRFYNQRIKNEISREVEVSIDAVKEYNRHNREIYRSFISSDYVKRSFLPNQSQEDIFERRTAYNNLKTKFPGLLFIRLVDTKGNIHYSTFDEDKKRESDFSVVYNRLRDVDESIPEDELLLSEGDAPRYIIDARNERLIYQFPFYDHFNIFKGTALFYVSKRDLKNALIKKDILEEGRSFSLVDRKGYLFNVDVEKNSEVKEELDRLWQSKTDYTSIKTEPVLANESDNRFFLFSTYEENVGFLGFLIPESFFTLNQYLKNILMVSFFLTVFLVLFLLLSIKQDKVLVLSERIKKFQINFLKEYVENRESVDWNRWQKEVERKKRVVTSEIKQGLGTLTKEREQEVDELINKSWDEILSIIGEKLESSRKESVTVPNKIEIENLEQVLERILRKGNIAIPVTQARGAGQQDAGQEVSREDRPSLKEAAEEETEKTSSGDDLEEIPLDEAAGEETEKAEEIYPVTYQRGEPIEVEEITEEEYLQEEAKEDELEEVMPVEDLPAQASVERDSVQIEKPAEKISQRETEKAEERDKEDVREEIQELEEVEEEFPENIPEPEPEEPEKPKPEQVEELPVESPEEYPEAESEQEEQLPIEEVEEEKEPQEIPEIEPEPAEEAVEEVEEIPDSEANLEDVEAADEEEEPSELTALHPEEETRVPEEIEEIEEIEGMEPAEELEETAELEEELEEEEDEFAVLEEVKELPFQPFAIENQEKLDELETVEEGLEEEAEPLEMVSGGYGYSSLFTCYTLGAFNQSFNWKASFVDEEVAAVEEYSNSKGGEDDGERGVEGMEPEEPEQVEIEEYEADAEPVSLEPASLESVPEERTEKSDHGEGDTQFKKIIGTLLKNKKIEIVDVEQIVQKYFGNNEAVESDSDGVPVIREDILQNGRDQRNEEFQALVKDVSQLSGSDEEEPALSIGDLFGSDDVDLSLSLFSEEEQGNKKEKEDAESSILSAEENRCFTGDGFNFGCFAKQFAPRQMQIMKSLLTISRETKAVFAAVLMEREEALVTDNSVGFDEISIQSLSFSKKEPFYRNFLQKRKCIALKMPASVFQPIAEKISQMDQKYLQGSIFFPITYNNRTGYIFLGLKVTEVTVEGIADKLNLLCNNLA